jgi:hypothetical protein
MTVGSLGEALAPGSAEVPRAIQVGGGLFCAVLFSTVFVLSLLTLVSETSPIAAKR